MNRFVAGFALGAAVSAALAAVSVHAGESSQAERNKAVAIEFYNRALNQLDFARASELIGPRYVQHNPKVIDGPQGLKNHIDDLRKNFPQNHGEIKHVIAEGDLVALHVLSKRTPESRGNAIVDIFRVENGKVVEHWDVVQPVPETSLNHNTMF